MKINVNYLFHCKKKRLQPYKDKHYVQIVHVSLSLPCPGVPLIVLFINTIVQSPDIVQILGLLVILQFCIVSVCILFWI